MKIGSTVRINLPGKLSKYDGVFGKVEGETSAFYNAKGWRVRLPDGMLLSFPDKELIFIEDEVETFPTESETAADYPSSTWSVDKKDFVIGVSAAITFEDGNALHEKIAKLESDVKMWKSRAESAKTEIYKLRSDILCSRTAMQRAAQNLRGF